MKTSFKSKIFHDAWTIFRATGKAFSICLVKAWAVFRLRKAMIAGVVRFAYEKADGSLRRAVGTLKEVSAMVKGTGSENYKTVAYYDLEAGGFRSFKVENLITVY
jgi:hypothetical protein